MFTAEHLEGSFLARLRCEFCPYFEREAPPEAAAPSDLFEVLDEFLQSVGVDFLEVGVDELVEELSLHHLVDAELRQVRAVVRDARLREVVGPDLVAAVAGADLVSALRVHLVLVLQNLHLEDLLLDNLQARQSGQVLE